MVNIILLLSVCTVDIESALRRAGAAAEEDGERGEKEEKEEEERDLRSSNKRGGKRRGESTVPPNHHHFLTDGRKKALTWQGMFLFLLPFSNFDKHIFFAGNLSL